LSRPGTTKEHEEEKSEEDRKVEDELDREGMKE